MPYTIFQPDDQDGPVDIVVVTNNDFPGAKNGIVVTLFGVRIVFFLRMFNPSGHNKDKNPDNVHDGDPNFILMRKFVARGLPKHIIVFGGLSSSGGTKITKQFAVEFQDHPEILEFLFCGCTREENTAIARVFDVSDIQIGTFGDHYPRCVDWQALYGRLIMLAYFLVKPDLKKKAMDDSIPKPSYRKQKK